jgi:manganese transport protein
VISGFVPRLPNQEALYIAIGIIGATVMPHNLYLHSALVQTRKFGRDDASIRQAIKWNAWDSGIALNLAFLVNTAILVLAAAAFFSTGRRDVGDIQQAYTLLAPLLGNKFAPLLFAIALIAAGQSSTVTGTLAGQIVMEGYLRLRINPWLRRLITRLLAIIPALIVLWIYGDKEINGLIILSQVILSLQLGFAVIPLIHFASDKARMGDFAIRRTTQVFAWGVAALLLYLNLDFVVGYVMDYFHGGGSRGIETLLIVGALAYVFLLGYTFYLPLRLRFKGSPPPLIHGNLPTEALSLDIPKYRTIAVALDFSANDMEIIILHIVESASARMLGQNTFDEESKEDERRIQFYAHFLQDKGFKARGLLGYRNRISEIVRLVRENQADMLVMGAHRHSGLQDFIHGETINSVRHGLRIPILVVNV